MVVMDMMERAKRSLVFLHCPLLLQEEELCFTLHHFISLSFSVLLFFFIFLFLFTRS